MFSISRHGQDRVRKALEALENETLNENKIHLLNHILILVTGHYKVNKEDLKVHTKGNYRLARVMIFILLRNQAKMDDSTIGNLFDTTRQVVNMHINSYLKKKNRSNTKEMIEFMNNMDRLSKKVSDYRQKMNLTI